MGLRPGVLDAVVLEDQPADLLELRRYQARTAEERPDALRLGRRELVEHRDQRERPLSLAQVRANRLAEPLRGRDKSERVVLGLGRARDVEAAVADRLDLCRR